MKKVRCVGAYLNFLIKKHADIGIDVDYIDQLNEDEKEFLLETLLEHYCGVTEDPDLKLKANQRRYHMKITDAMVGSLSIDEINEELYALEEELSNEDSEDEYD